MKKHKTSIFLTKENAGFLYHKINKGQQNSISDYLNTILETLREIEGVSDAECINAYNDRNKPKKTLETKDEIKEKLEQSFMKSQVKKWSTGEEEIIAGTLRDNFM